MNKITVIMPFFNAESHILRGVGSALDQSFDNIELIVVNDGSTDRSLELLHQINDHRINIINQPKRGVSVARNRGLQEASGEYIAFLDTDDTWHPNCLEILNDTLNSHPSAVLVYCGWQNVGLSGGAGKPYVPPDYEKEVKLEHLLRSCPWPIHAALARRRAIESAGKFDEHLTNSEDYKLWLRVASFNRIVRVPEVLAFYHFHEGFQASKNRAKAAIGHRRVQKQFIKEYPEIERQLGAQLIRHLTNGILLRSGYECYWKRDLEEARKIFRLVIRTGYGSLKDWKYMLPSLLPFSVHRYLIHLLERDPVMD
jgi:glycosyltransferase involved in cell wall biosynthesis